MLTNDVVDGHGYDHDMDCFADCGFIRPWDNMVLLTTGSRLIGGNAVMLMLLIGG